MAPFESIHLLGPTSPMTMKQETNSTSIADLEKHDKIKTELLNRVALLATEVLCLPAEIRERIYMYLWTPDILEPLIWGFECNCNGNSSCPCVPYPNFTQASQVPNQFVRESVAWMYGHCEIMLRVLWIEVFCTLDRFKVGLYPGMVSLCRITMAVHLGEQPRREIEMIYQHMNSIVELKFYHKARIAIKIKGYSEHHLAEPEIRSAWVIGPIRFINPVLKALEEPVKKLREDKNVIVDLKYLPIPACELDVGRMLGITDTDSWMHFIKHDWRVFLETGSGKKELAKMSGTLVDYTMLNYMWGTRTST